MYDPQRSKTAKNTVISPNFLVWKFCGKAQFLSLGFSHLREHNFTDVTYRYRESFMLMCC